MKMIFWALFVFVITEVMVIGITACDFSTKKEPIVPQIQRDRIIAKDKDVEVWVIIIDSCEYIERGISTFHKGNCKFCAARNRKSKI